MSELVFLLEEPSMKEFLDTFLPRILPERTTFRTIPHSGKADLKKSIPIKLRAWKGDVRFIVLHDKDSNDCVSLKNELLQLCIEGGRPGTLVRIVCTELESWYLGDLEAVAKAYDMTDLSRKQNIKKFREPDKLGNPKEELKKMVKAYQQISGARNIAQYINPDSNMSCSFKVFIDGVKKIIAEAM